MWEQIRILCPAAQPVHMLLDFEKAVINSFTHVWPNALVKCCFFYLTQNIWRKVQTVGLQADYIHNEELALAICNIPALAFAPPDCIPDLFAQVAQELPPTSQIAELLDYFQSTSIGRTSLGGYYQTATFPNDLWNYHYDTPLGLPRTTNAVEAWHRSFNATVGCHHPSIWKFIPAHKREQGLVEVRQARFIAGNSPIKRKKSLQSEKSLTKLVGRV